MISVRVCYATALYCILGTISVSSYMVIEQKTNEVLLWNCHTSSYLSKGIYEAYDESSSFNHCRINVCVRTFAKTYFFFYRFYCLKCFLALPVSRDRFLR